MSRSFTLGHEVDETKAQARYADGVLTLTLPKKVQTPVKKLTIS
jgi:HSP20 family protein